MVLPEKATQRTLYFIGVTTTKSSIMKLYPLWAEALGIGDTVIKGIDIEIHADPQVYRKVVEFIKQDELSMGALVTTHKIDLFNAAKDIFDHVHPYAEMFGEVSCIAKKNGSLEASAKDHISSRLSMEAFIPQNFWKDHGGEVLIMGAGGAAIAISSNLLNKQNGANVPSKVIISNRSQARLAKIEKLIRETNPEINRDVEVEFHLTPEPGQNDALLHRLKPYSLVINATGLGKDRPGSPLLDSCQFPENSLIWELNYRGDLGFMHQALAQKDKKNLHVEDGWIYFLHGWTQVIGEVFDIDIRGELFERVAQIANEWRKNG
jgi:shikimate 5-dehydrogenase